MTQQPPAPEGQVGADRTTCYRHHDRETYVSCQRCGKPICPDCMRPAAVGHQCPDCVKEGARSTRSGRSVFGGARVANAQTTSIGLIVANAAVWLLVLATGGHNGRVFTTLSLLPTDTVYNIGGRITEVTGVSGGAYWQLLTSAFTHEAITHIGFNMVALYFLGPPLEAALGRARFLALYLISALAGSAAVLWFAGEHTLTMGASGAIFGLMGALVVVSLRLGTNPSQILLWIGLNLVITFTVSNISWQGHIGGLVGGALCAGAIVLAPRGPRRSLVQWSGLAAVLVVVLLVIAARLATLS